LAAGAGPRPAGIAVESSHVEPAFGRDPDWPRVAHDLELALAGRLPIEAGLAERARTYAKARVAAPRRAAPRLLVDDHASARATVVEVRAPDGIAVLYRITRALATLG